MTAIADPTRSPEVPSTSEIGQGAASAEKPLHFWHRRLAASRVLFPFVTFLALGILWMAALDLVEVERKSAHRSALASSEELLETYEAQMVRALREIDLALKSIQYSYRLRGDGVAVLADLAGQDLLPPSLVFTVSLANREGEVVATNGGSGHQAPLDPGSVERVRRSDDLLELPAVRSGGQWRLVLGRKLTAPDGTFAGVATVDVDAEFFVSGYDPSRLGQRGFLALLGTDGVFRVRRSGNHVIFGGRTSYRSLVGSGRAGLDTESVLALNPWDGVRRYTSARELYDYPLAVVVGLEESEQFALAEEHSATYVSRAVAASVLLLLVMTTLGWMQWRLDVWRRRGVENRVASAKQIEHLAYHDALTGLPNRSCLARILEDRIRQVSRYGSEFAVLFLDLDRFKQINDTLGHDAGDELLREMARRLEAALRDSDTVSRMGGDEFVILLSELAHEHHAATVAHKILSVVKEPFVLLGERFNVTVSIGISVFPRDGEDEQTLMKNADIALYEAKDAGRNSFRFYRAEMSAASIERLELETSLRMALTNQELELHYQPRRDLDSGRITGVEALLRWCHPQRGLIGPPEFLDLAEETGLILPIGRWVLRTACRQSAAWAAEGLPPVVMAVNLSAQQFFDDRLLADVNGAIEESGIAPEVLELEICEGLLARDSERSMSVLRQLKALGVRITVDNFGIGYTALSVLRQLPVDAIKIDRQLLGESSDPAAREVIDAVASMARTLSSSVVAQGVETRGQVEHLSRAHGGEVQGFFFDGPVPVAEVSKLLRFEAARVSDLAAVG